MQLLRELERITGIKSESTICRWNEQWVEKVIDQAKFEVKSRSATVMTGMDEVCSLGNTLQKYT